MTGVLVSPVTVPTTGAMLSEVAPRTVHASVEVPPAAMDAGVAVKLLMVRAVPLVTVTVVVAVVLPLALVAVRV